LAERRKNPLKQWKLSTIDMQAQKMWEDFTSYKEKMFDKTHTDDSPWVIIKGNNKQTARIEAMRYVLSQINYTDKSDKEISFKINPEIIQIYQGK
jgi:polyphosphate kinase 2 (PPK2 family)